MDNICEKKRCCGCGLCEAVCPCNAISMKHDEEGFRIPSMDNEKCVSCGACIRVCPVNRYKQDDAKSDYDKHLSKEYPIAFSAKKKNVFELLKSSAGGVANSIGRYIVENGGVVFGVRYKKDYRGAEYAIARNLGELEAFNESKYVESDRNFLFKNIQAELSSGKKVLVIGLPCDIAAVSSLVGCPDNLYLCRLICRSNTSEKALNEFVDKCEEEAGAPLSKLSLRYKEEGCPTLPTRYKMVFRNGTIRTGDFTRSDYGKAFQIYARKSCFSCFAKESIKGTDLIIGDYQGLTSSDALYGKNGLSLVFCFTDKGKEMLDGAHDLCIKAANYEHVWNYNWMIYTPIPESPYREDFSRRFIDRGLRYACHELCKEQNSYLDSLRHEFANTEKRVALWGAGDTADYLYERLDMDKWNIIGVFDGSKMKQGKAFRGKTIEDIKNIIKVKDCIDALVLMIPSENEKKLEDFVLKLGYSGRIIHAGKYKFYREEEHD